MERRYSLEELEKILGEKVQPSKEDLKIGEFFQLFQRSKKEPEKPCPEGDEDCSDLLSSCCNSILSTVFGTLPLEVECSGCGKRYLLREVINLEQKS